MDHQPYIDLILENEGLTGSLSEKQAAILLEWGVKSAHQLVDNSPDSDSAALATGSLMKLLRGINRLIGSLPETSTTELLTLLERYAKTFGKARQASDSVATKFLASLAQTKTDQIVESLIIWLAPEKDH